MENVPLVIIGLTIVGGFVLIWYLLQTIPIFCPAGNQIEKLGYTIRYQGETSHEELDNYNRTDRLTNYTKTWNVCKKGLCVATIYAKWDNRRYIAHQWLPPELAQVFRENNITVTRKIDQQTPS